VRDLGVADELQGDDAPRAFDVVVVRAVEVALDGDECEAVDVLEPGERGLDRLGLRDVERDAVRVPADSLRRADWRISRRARMKRARINQGMTGPVRSGR
jgi:hypothetical protein